MTVLIRSFLILLLIASPSWGAWDDMTFTWQDNSDNEDGFIVEYRDLGVIPGEEEATWIFRTLLPANTTSWVEAEAPRGDWRCYQIRSYVTVDGVQVKSDPSNAICGYTPQLPPLVGGCTATSPAGQMLMQDRALPPIGF